MSFDIVIEDTVTLPKRKANFGPRKPSKWQAAFEKMSEGQGFYLPITGKDDHKKQDGTVLTVAEDAERQARQLQGRFSTIGKRLGIVVHTRYVSTKPEGEDALIAKWEQFNGSPFLVVQHAGARPADEADADAGSDPDSDEGDGDDDGDVLAGLD